MIRRTNMGFYFEGKSYPLHKAETLQDVFEHGREDVAYWVEENNSIILNGYCYGFYDGNGSYFTRIEEPYEAFPRKQEVEEFIAQMDEERNWDDLFASLLEQSALPEETDFYRESVG